MKVNFECLRVYFFIILKGFRVKYFFYLISRNVGGSVIAFVIVIRHFNLIFPFILCTAYNETQKYFTFHLFIRLNVHFIFLFAPVIYWFVICVPDLFVFPYPTDRLFFLIKSSHVCIFISTYIMNSLYFRSIP